jgi:hypothetical protein
MKNPGQFLVALGIASLAATGLLASHAVGGVDVNMVNDNNNVDGGTPNPGFDAQNRQQNETTVAISPANPSIVAAGANDYRMVPVVGDGWLGVYTSADGGATWFNTMVPGFPSDTSPAGLASPLLGLDGAGDPVVRFDAAGNLYAAGIAFNRDFDVEDQNNDTVVFVARYNYTPGTPGQASTPSSAGNPPNFTYAFTTIVDRGAVGFAIPPGQRWGIAGIFDDKNWLGVDTSPSSPCDGNIYYTYTKFAGSLGGQAVVQFARSTDGGLSFAEPRPITVRSQEGTVFTQGSSIATASDGTVYVSYRTFASSSDPTTRQVVVRSEDCGRRFSAPVTAATYRDMPRQAPGLAFRTPTESAVAVDDLDPDTVYVAYMALAGSPANADIFVVRSTDGGLTWGAPAKVNDDATRKHQFWPTIAVSHGAVHLAWYDFRDSPDSTNPAGSNNELNVYYASSGTSGVAYPAFSHNVRVTDVGHNPNCLMFGGGTTAFHGDYIEIAARYTGTEHVVHVTWADNRDVSPCDLDPAPGPASDNTGNRNQNVYADRLVITP